jgi:hypothetical protein
MKRTPIAGFTGKAHFPFSIETVAREGIFRNVSDFFPRGRDEEQGCQIYLDTIHQKRGKIYQIATKLPNGRKMYQTAVIYSKCP